MMRLFLMLLLIEFAADLHFPTTEALEVEEATRLQLQERFPLELNQEGEQLENVMKELWRGESMAVKPLPWVKLDMSNGSIALQGNVKCGGGYCPSEAPICCGKAPSYYCVPGGSKCCSALGSAEMACGQNTECCATRNNVTCCGKDTVCIKDGDESKCVKDVCAIHNTADECLNEEDGCGWCCEEQRCVSNGTRCSMGGTAIVSGEVCPSLCQYANTCGLCLLSQEYNTSGPCLWCCSTQSCISSSSAFTCANDQRVDSLGQCSACQANGAGINPRFIGTYAQILAILSAVILIIGIMSCIGVIRAFVCYRGSIVTHNGMRLADVDAQRAVRRHGFGSSEPLSTGRQAKNKLKSYLNTIISVLKSNSKSKVEGEYKEGDENSPLNSVLSCAKCQRTLQAHALPNVANSMKGIKTPRNRIIEDSVRKNQEVDDDIVILLPCGHLFCRPCLGLRVKEKSSVVIKDKHIEQPQSLTSVQFDKSNVNGENNFLCFNTEGDAATSENRETRLSEGSPALFAEEYQNLPHQHLEGQRARYEEVNVTERRESSHSQIEKWREGLLRSLHGLHNKNAHTNVQEENDENVVQKKIKHKCPVCQKAVKDVLLPENILQL
ncbi:uncharacterized protein TM35_000082720 [Trypanosoma theileri]|uniref:RING-type domain-containing protein n=1 Tax=Trypanosoma theileri TaxID=67003 RepID=A0A1X0P0K5_9TRYP|nr:uncharacterized protein TM35_000082720 [Trypanosoma theileri]ORC90474.1 hypothetical protein TM35_000082720 [Trypanosoma theileri]